MIINKVSYKNEIMEVHYSILKEGGKEDFHTVRSGDQPLPSFRNLLLKLRKSVVSILELPDNDEEVKKITVNQVSFDYTGEDNIMGAVISARRKLTHCSGVMALNTPHKFVKTTSKSGKGNSSLVFDKPVSDMLDELQEEAIKYVEGERSQTELFKDAKVTVPAKVETKPDRKAGKKDKKKVAAEPKKKFQMAPSGPDDPIYAIKAKGKYITISPKSALNLTALICEPGVMQASVHEGMQEIGYAGNKILLEIDGGLLQIHSAVSGYKQINNENLAKNVIEELIQDFVDQPVLRLRPQEPVGLSLVNSEAAQA